MTSETAAGLLDTNVVINLSRLADADALPDIPLISAVTLAELSVGPLVAPTDQERATRQAMLQQAEADFDPVPFDAVAVARDLPLYTCNPDDFASIDGLRVVQVPVP